MKYLAIYVLLLSCVSKSFCLKLLLLFPPPIKSHYMLGNALGKGLAKAGHAVTMVSSISEKNPPANFKQILISDIFDKEAKKTNNMRIYEMEKLPAMFQLQQLSDFGNIFLIKLFEHPKIQKLLKSDKHFDAVIMEQFWNEGLKIFAYHFKAPLILLSTIGPSRWVNNLVANPEPPSYVPDLLLSLTGDMNLFQRIHNLLFGLLADLYLYLIFYPSQHALVKKYYPNAPDMNDVQYNVSLVLLNSHESVNQPVPHVPNMINIGGFHVNPPKDLPKDLKEFMDSAKDGVIYFSMGSNLVPSDMPKEKLDAILKVLGSRKEKVLWKWDEDNLENKPNNMMISKWFPQQDILAHPNCKLFITHGGLLSTTETIYFGVPVLAIPIFGDQKLNAARAASLGYARHMQFSQINEVDFAKTVNELLNNPSYRENAKLRSKLMHDRPVKPMDLAIYWIEYVVRHKGAPHLRVAGVNLPLYKYYMLDIIGLALAVLVLVKYILLKIGRYVKAILKRTISSIESKKKLE